MTSVGVMASAVHLVTADCVEVVSDPCDNFSAAPWTVAGTPSITASGVVGNAFSIPAATTNYITYDIPAPAQHAQMHVGFWIYFTTLPPTTLAFASFRSDAAATEHTTLRVNSPAAGGRFAHYRDTGQVDLSASGLAVLNTWMYFEAYCKLADTFAEWDIRLNGITIMAQSGSIYDTKNAGTKTVYDSFRFVGASSLAYRLDDVYLRMGPLCSFKGIPPVTGCVDVLSEPFNDFTTNGWATPAGTSIVAGRTGTAAAVTGGASNFAAYSIAAFNRSDTVTFGFAWRFTDTFTANPRNICTLHADTPGTNTLHNRLIFTPSTTTLVFTRGSSTTIASTTSVTMTQNNWYYIEVQCKLHDTAGFVRVRVNGVEVITSAATLDTKEGGTSTVYEMIRLGPNLAGGPTGQYDDLYLSTGTTCGFKGDVNPPVCTDVLLFEPFNNLSAWATESTPTIVAGGRTGTAVECNSSSDGIAYALGVNESAHVTVGFALWATSMAGGPDVVRLLGDNGTLKHGSLVLGNDGSLRGFRGASTLGAATAAGTIVVNTWYYIEVQAFLHDTAGFMKVRLNGVEVLNYTNVDTRMTSTDSVYDGVSFRPSALSSTLRWDDVYISTGSVCTFKGDVNPPVLCTDVLLEPFNNFTMAPWTNLDPNGFGSAYSSVIVAGGRTGTCADVTGGGLAGADYTIPAPSRSDTLTIGFAYRTSAISSQPLIDFRSDSDTVSHFLLNLQNQGGLGNFQFTSQSSNKWSTAVDSVPINTWIYVELQVKLHETTGFATCRINGVEAATATNIDTKATSTDTAISLIRLKAKSGGNHQFDDMYISTGVGCTFKGSITIP